MMVAQHDMLFARQNLKAYLIIIIKQTLLKILENKHNPENVIKDTLTCIGLYW